MSKATIDLDGTITDGGELTESYSVENGEVKMSKQELITNDRKRRL